VILVDANILIDVLSQASRGGRAVVERVGRGGA
jgi:hypothetical protein